MNFFEFINKTFVDLPDVSHTFERYTKYSVIHSRLEWIVRGKKIITTCYLVWRSGAPRSVYIPIFPARRCFVYHRGALLIGRNRTQRLCRQHNIICYCHMVTKRTWTTKIHFINRMRLIPWATLDHCFTWKVRNVIRNTMTVWYLHYFSNEKSVFFRIRFVWTIFEHFYQPKKMFFFFSISKQHIFIIYYITSNLSVNIYTNTLRI